MGAARREIVDMLDSATGDANIFTNWWGVPASGAVPDAVNMLRGVPPFSPGGLTFDNPGEADSVISHMYGACSRINKKSKRDNCERWVGEHLDDVRFFGSPEYYDAVQRGKNTGIALGGIVASAAGLGFLTNLFGGGNQQQDNSGSGQPNSPTSLAGFDLSNPVAVVGFVILISALLMLLFSKNPPTP